MSKPPISGSSRHKNKYFLYWWDITPGMRDRIIEHGQLMLKRDDTGETTIIPQSQIVPLLTSDRQTSRGKDPMGGNWGIRELADHPNAVFIEEPGISHKDWQHNILVSWRHI
jgi:hypothetical protein